MVEESFASALPFIRQRGADESMLLPHYIDNTLADMTSYDIKN